MIGNLLNFLKKSNLYFLRKSVTAEFDERQYLFLKRLCQVLVTLGEVQLFHLWVRVKITFKKHPFFCKTEVLPDQFKVSISLLEKYQGQ